MNLFPIAFLGAVYNKKRNYRCINPKRDTDMCVEIEEKVLRQNSPYYEIEAKYPKITFKNRLVEEVINCKITYDVTRFVEEIKNQAIKTYNSIPNQKYSVTKFVGTTDFKIRRNNNILSLTITYYTYKGGYHGYFNQVAYNYDLKTCKRLILKDLFYTNYDYLVNINKELNRQIDENKEQYYIEGKVKINDEQPFYLDNKHLVIFFELYEIAPFVKGIPEFSIPFEYFGDRMNF